MTAKALAGRLAALEAHAGTIRARVSPVPMGEPDNGKPWEPVTEAAWLAIYGAKEDGNAQP